MVKENQKQEGRQNCRLKFWNANCLLLITHRNQECSVVVLLFPPSPSRKCRSLSSQSSSPTKKKTEMRSLQPLHFNHSTTLRDAEQNSFHTRILLLLLLPFSSSTTTTMVPPPPATWSSMSLHAQKHLRTSKPKLGFRIPNTNSPVGCLISVFVSTTVSVTLIVKLLITCHVHFVRKLRVYAFSAMLWLVWIILWFCRIAFSLAKLG